MFSYSLILLHVFPINGKKRICVQFLFEDSFRVLKINKAKKVRAWQRWRREPANVFELPSFALPSSLLPPLSILTYERGDVGEGEAQVVLVTHLCTYVGLCDFMPFFPSLISFPLAVKFVICFITESLSR